MAWSIVFKRPRGTAANLSRGTRRMQPRRSINYAEIKAGVYARIAALPAAQQQVIGVGTLPEMMVGLALALLGLPAQSQVDELGGRLWIGGGVIDWKVWLGNQIVVVRVQGDYWHSQPDRRTRDLMQLQRLRALGYRVADIWEHELYLAWVENRLKAFVNQKVMNAA